VRGLFVSPNYPVLQATYCDLAALEILGALNQIDPEACVQGILRLHRAKGYFPNPEGNSSFGISGNAQDTFCAFESLRILGALDRVKDLDKWQFRPGEVSKPGAAPRVVTWDEIEAWVCAQRLARDLAEHKQNPAAPWRSLREP
jgi:prenyltransferase beta subunit